MRRPQQIAPAALILLLAVAGFAIARDHGRQDARRDSDHQAEVAAAEIRARVQQGTSLSESLGRLMVGVAGRGVDGDDFARNAARWLSPAGAPAAAWVEQVPASGRAAYERRAGHPIVTPDSAGGTAPAARRASYLPATLVSGIAPMAVAGLDIGAEPGVAAALARARSLYDTGATPLAVLRDGSDGVLLFKFAPRLSEGVVHPGYVVVFASELWLRAAATGEPTVRLAAGHGPPDADDPTGGETVHRTFTEAGQRFDVAVPRVSAHGTARALPWVILAAGVVLAGLAVALGVNARRRGEAQEELDRIFTLSPDVITVADFDGRFTRVNPATERTLGYTEAELLDTPYVELVHPDDRDRTLAQARDIVDGNTTTSFENRFLRKDGGTRVLEWTATPSPSDRVMYGVARDVTERREAEQELAKVVDEQAALRRVATLVARGVPPAELFAAVAAEIRRQLDAKAIAIGRFEPDEDVAVIVASSDAPSLPVGTRLALRDNAAMRAVRRTGRVVSLPYDGDRRPPQRADGSAGGPAIRCSLAVPIMVEGTLWGVVSAGTDKERFPDDAEQRMSAFTELTATAIANAENRSELTASRARIVAASDQTRREIERDLHDGAQQRLVHTVVTLKLARKSLADGRQDVPDLIAEALDQAERANVELRDLVQGILPPVLTRGGLRPAIASLTSRMPVPVQLGVDVGRLPPAVEATAYFVVAEALTNVVKHSGAGRATVAAQVVDDVLQVRVRDDGRGGAYLDGSGFVGLADRLAVLDGQLRVQSPEDGGTAVEADIPLDGHRPA